MQIFKVFSRFLKNFLNTGKHRDLQNEISRIPRLCQNLPPVSALFSIKMIFFKNPDISNTPLMSVYFDTPNPYFHLGYVKMKPFCRSAVHN